MFTRGPPLFPLFIAASVWIMSYRSPVSVEIVRPNPLIIPAVTLGPPVSPKAFPMVKTQSPGTSD